MKNKRKMLLICMGILLICMVLWRYGYDKRNSPDNLPALSSFKEEYLEDLKGYQRKQLQEVWQMPSSTSHIEEAEQDMWFLPDGRQLFVTYNTHNQVEKAEIASPQTISPAT